MNTGAIVELKRLVLSTLAEMQQASPDSDAVHDAQSTMQSCMDQLNQALGENGTINSALAYAKLDEVDSIAGRLQSKISSTPALSALEPLARKLVQHTGTLHQVTASFLMETGNTRFPM